ncbi:MAG: alpha/beta fold hydrolase [Actinobacteria bacterium]|nr:alpha/beta fold hydrolase [Actinomycetota bacterium]
MSDRTLLGPGDLEELQKQTRALPRLLRGTGSLVGAVRELMWFGVDVALYPVGFLAGSASDRMTERWLHHHRPLPVDIDCELRGTPIVMVHGWFHNRSGFFVMRRALRRVGFAHLFDMNLNPIRQNVQSLAARLSERVDQVMAQTGADHVHLIGHSLGGIVARYYVQNLGGAERVDTVITLGTPHGGTVAAFGAAGRLARQLRPGSTFLRALDGSARPSGVRWIAFSTNLDVLVVPSRNARLEVEALDAENVLIRDLGHMSLLVSPDLIHEVVVRLAQRERGNVRHIETARSRRGRRTSRLPA